VLAIERQRSETPPIGNASIGLSMVPLVTTGQSGARPDLSGPGGSNPTSTVRLTLTEPSEVVLTRSSPAVRVIVATGPLPSLAAGPLGGVLAAVDEETVVDPRDPSVVDVALLDLPSEGFETPDSTGTAADSLDPAASVGVYGPLVSVRGPGGIPLLG